MDHLELSPARSPLGPLPGAVCTQFIRCGNPRCCCRQGKPHGPYYYRVWRDGARVRKQYVKRSEMEAVRAACAEYARRAAQLRELRRLAASPRKRERAAGRRRSEIGETGTDAYGSG